MIDFRQLSTKFERMTARIKSIDMNTMPNARVLYMGATLNIGKDDEGEFFSLTAVDDDRLSVEVLDLQPADRHLLLMVRERDEKSKYLCGHDERHWFVAAVPETAPVGTVRAAMEALKPKAVLDVQSRLGLSLTARNRRKNAAFRRQGEWFFVPQPQLKVDDKLVLRNEPIRRGGGKPHWCDFLYRRGGVTVQVCRQYPNGLLAEEYRALIREKPEAKNLGWTTMTRDPSVYVRGRVRHLDHKTITLHGWHQVLMNTETQAKAMRHVAYLD